MKTWATANRTNGIGSGEVNLLRILDVNGTRVVISGAYLLGTSAADRAKLDQIVASIRFEPRPTSPSPSP